MCGVMNETDNNIMRNNWQILTLISFIVNLFFFDSEVTGIIEKYGVKNQASSESQICN